MHTDLFSRESFCSSHEDAKISFLRLLPQCWQGSVGECPKLCIHPCSHGVWVYLSHGGADKSGLQNLSSRLKPIGQTTNIRRKGRSGRIGVFD